MPSKAASSGKQKHPKSRLKFPAASNQVRSPMMRTLGGGTGADETVGQIALLAEADFFKKAAEFLRSLRAEIGKPSLILAAEVGD